MTRVELYDSLKQADNTIFRSFLSTQNAVVYHGKWLLQKNTKYTDWARDGLCDMRPYVTALATSVMSHEMVLTCWTHEEAMNVATVAETRALN